MIDLTGGEVRTLLLLVPRFYGRKSQSLETGALHISTVESKADLAFRENQNFLKYWVEPDR